MHCHPTNLLAMTYVHELDTKSFTHTLWEMSTECIVVFHDGVEVLPWMLCGTGEIGAATAKGLAWGAGKPCAPCSTLKSMAWPLAHLEGRLIVCAMDARRKQVYNALFRAEGENLERLSPDRAISLDELGEELKKFPEPKIVVGDGAQLCYNTLSIEVSGLTLAPAHLRMQSALGVAWAAEELLASGGPVSGGELAPVYHRLSQAERERLEREQNTKYTIEGDLTHV